MSRPLKLAFILDPLEGLKAYKDSSIAMMRAAAARGHEVWALQREALTWRDGAVAGSRCVPLTPLKQAGTVLARPKPCRWQRLMRC